MQTNHHLASAPSRRVEALRARHAALQDRIDEEQKHAAVMPEIVRALKLEKLKIKEQLETEMRRS